MILWKAVLDSTARKARAAVLPILGTSEANIDVGAGAGGDTTKKIDAIAEDLIIDELRKTGQPIKIFTEERGLVFINCPDNSEKVNLHAIIDPIDGSFNATRNLPFFAVSIAIASGPRVKDITDGVVLNVATGDVLAATRGKGAWLNGTQLKPLEQDIRLLDAAMGIDLNPKRREFERSDLIRRFASLINAPRKIRVLGSNALELCLVATGALDCFIDVRGSLRIMDIAAAWLIVKENGGHVVQLRDGNTLELDSLELGIDVRMAVLAAGNLELKKEMEKIPAG